MEVSDVTTVEQDIAAKGLTALRVTPTDIEAKIAREFTFNAGSSVSAAGGLTLPISAEHQRSLDLLTIYVLVLKNGFTVTGESACASPENYNQEIGRKVARQHAVEKIWPLLGYELRTKLQGDNNA
jgi:hypothetical protein